MWFGAQIKLKAPQGIWLKENNQWQAGVKQDLLQGYNYSFLTSPIH